MGQKLVLIEKLRISLSIFKVYIQFRAVLSVFCQRKRWISMNFDEF
jgi:hypothetical protein